MSTLVNFRLELLLIAARKRLRGGKLIGHLIERNGKGIQLLDSTARNPQVGVAVCKPRSGFEKASDRTHYTPYRADANNHQQEQNACADPGNKHSPPRFGLCSRRGGLRLLLDSGLGRGQRRYVLRRGDRSWWDVCRSGALAIRVNHALENDRLVRQKRQLGILLREILRVLPT